MAVAEVINRSSEFGFCEICDNGTPRVEVVEDNYSELCCLYCWDAYGEMN